MSDTKQINTGGAGGQHTCAGLAFALRRGRAEWISLSIRNGNPMATADLNEPPFMEGFI